MSKTIELLLVENVDNLGIVGDVVKVKSGYARNYLLPHAYATFPDEAILAGLAEKRKQAEQMVAELRAQQESIVTRLDGYTLKLERSCNDQGQLYGSVSQQDITKALNDAGFGVRERDVRLSQTIKRIGSFDVPIKFTSDLFTELALDVVSDRPLEDQEPELELDDEGNIIEDGGEAEAPEAAAAPEGEEADGENAEG